uniref:Uncharacterized protein n=1 Tax=Cacopsylla melanoneura TaxID=428564 RepID=A0A8D8YFM1_9HEMI
MNNKRSRSTVRSTKEKAFNNKMKPQKDKNTEDKNTSLIIDTMDNAEKTDYVELKYDVTHLSELHNDKHISVIFDKLFKKLAKKYQDITTLGNELTTLKEQYEDLEKNNKELENSKKQTENINKQITNDHEEEIQKLEKKVKDKEDENEKLKNCINNLKEKETNMKADIEQLTENLNRNKVMEKKFEDQKHIYEDTIKQNHNETQRIETDNIGLRVKIQETEDRIKDLLKEYSNQVTNLESKVKIKQDEISNLKNDINDSMKIREEMEKAVDIFKTEINKNAILIQHKDKQSSRWKRMVDEKDTELVNKSNDIEKLEVAIKIMKMKMTVMEEVISKNNTENNDKRNTVRYIRDQSETIAEESDDESFNMGPQFSDSLYILSYNEQSIANEIDETFSIEANNYNATNGQNHIHHHPQKDQHGRNIENYITCTNIDNHIPCDDADKNNPGGGTSKEDNKLKRKEDNDPNNPSEDVHNDRSGDDNGKLNGGDNSDNHDVDNDSDNTKGAGSGGGTEDGGPNGAGSDGGVDDDNHNDGVGDSNHNGGDSSGVDEGGRHNGGTYREETDTGGSGGDTGTCNPTHTTPGIVIVHQKCISDIMSKPTREKPDNTENREFCQKSIILEKLAYIENKMKEYEQRIDHLEEPKNIQQQQQEQQQQQKQRQQHQQLQNQNNCRQENTTYLKENNKVVEEIKVMSTTELNMEQLYTMQNGIDFCKRVWESTDEACSFEYAAHKYLQKYKNPIIDEVPMWNNNNNGGNSGGSGNSSSGGNTNSNTNNSNGSDSSSSGDSNKHGSSSSNGTSGSNSGSNSGSSNNNNKQPRQQLGWTRH